MLTENQTVKNNRYSIKSPIGRNGSGIYYEAFDSESKAIVLLKEIPESLNKVTTVTELEARKQTFADKAKILSQIKHETLLQVQDYFSEINQHYLVIENQEGKSLGEILEKEQNPLPLNIVLDWAVQILDAVNYLHNQNPPIYHLEIKPESLKLTSEGQIKLSTHNIILQLENNKETVLADEQFDSSNLAFAPLEQIWDFLDSASQNLILNNFDEDSQKNLEKTPDGRSDIYSIGAVLYYLLTAHLPFDSLTRLIDILDGKEDPLPAPDEINPNIPHEISDILLNALEIKRENRYSSAMIMKQILRTNLAKVTQRQEFAENNGEAKEEFSQVLKPESRINEIQTPAKQFDEEQKQQLELIKKQLREAEERRLEAEKRAAEAERLLREQEQQIAEENELFEQQWAAEENAEKLKEVSPTPLIETTETKIDVEPEFIIESDVESESEIEFEPVSEIKDNLENNVESQIDAEYFGDLYEETKVVPKKGKPILKIAVGAFILLIIGGVGWGFWNFYDVSLIQGESTISTEKLVPPVAIQEKTPQPIPENLETDEVEVQMEESPIVQEEIIPNNAEVTPIPTPQPTVSAPIKDNQNQVIPPKRNVPPIRKNNLPKPSQQNPKPAPTKKTVTLDDLINDG